METKYVTGIDRALGGSGDPSPVTAFGVYYGMKAAIQELTGSDSLKGKTVAELREIAKGIEHEAVHGYTQLNKDHLLVALCTALKISTHEHHATGGYDKAAIKAKMTDFLITVLRLAAG